MSDNMPGSIIHEPQPSVNTDRAHDLPSAGGLKHESAERIFRLLQFLLANECTRKDVFDRLASYYKLDSVVPNERSKRKRSPPSAFAKELMNALKDHLI